MNFKTFSSVDSSDLIAQSIRASEQNSAVYIIYVYVCIYVNIYTYISMINHHIIINDKSRNF